MAEHLLAEPLLGQLSSDPAHSLTQGLPRHPVLPGLTHHSPKTTVGPLLGFELLTHHPKQLGLVHLTRRSGSEWLDLVFSGHGRTLDHLSQSCDVTPSDLLFCLSAIADTIPERSPIYQIHPGQPPSAERVAAPNFA